MAQRQDLIDNNSHREPGALPGTGASMSKFMDYQSFKAKSPEGMEIGKGTTCCVYTADDHVVKKFFEDSNSFQAFINEIDLYARLDHPCLPKVNAFSMDDQGKGYLTLSKGINIQRAYNEGLISLEAIATDMIEVLMFLHEHAIAHCDIKPGNMIYYQGRACLIDFGLAQRCFLYQSGDPVWMGSAYTVGFRDPNIIFSGLNSIKTDLYALGKSLILIHDNEPYFKLTSEIFTAPEFKGDPLMADFIKQCTKPIKDRPSALALSQHPIIQKDRHYQGHILKPPTVTADPKCGPFLPILFDWIMLVAYKRDLSAQVVFLALHLIHRSLSVVLPNYHVKKGTDIKQIQNLGIGCLIIASAIYTEMGNDVFEYYARLCDRAYNPTEIRKMCVRILDGLNGVIDSPNYFDFASCAEDLPAFLDMATSCTYDPMITPSPLDRPTSKFIYFRSVYRTWKSQRSSDLSPLDYLKAKVGIAPDKTVPAMIRPIYGQPPDFTRNDFDRLITQFHSSSTKNDRLVDVIAESVGALTRHPEYFAQLSPGQANSLYRRLSYDSTFWPLMRSIVRFAFDKKKLREYPYQKRDFNPFTWDGSF